MLIIDCVRDGFGWSPIHHLIALSSRLLEAEIARVPAHPPSLTHKLLSTILKRRPRPHSRETCLLICPGPADLIRLLQVPDWRRRYSFVGAWIIDSFWWDHIPRTLRRAMAFDRFFVTTLEDVDQWKRLTGTPTVWLPWGSDVYGQGGGEAEREWDLTRVGRQPPEWNDDSTNAMAARSAGLTYRGRVPGDALTHLENQALMMTEVYRRSKYILAFSNAANPESYTHPTREYFTGRWVDALACGAVVAGIPPRCTDVDRLLWPGSLLVLENTRRSEGMALIADAVMQWTPKIARRNYWMALQKLDWRWRIDRLATEFSSGSSALRAELEGLKARIAGLAREAT